MSKIIQLIITYKIIQFALSVIESLVQTSQIAIDVQIKDWGKTLSFICIAKEINENSKTEKRIRNKIQERRLNPYQDKTDDHKDSWTSSNGFPKRKSNRIDASYKQQKTRAKSSTQK